MSSLLYGALTLRREQATTPAQLSELRKVAAEARAEADTAADTADTKAAALGAAASNASELAAQAEASEATVESADAKKPPDFVDVVAALVPAEVIAVHALILGHLSTKTEDASGAVVTKLDPTHPDQEKIAWIALVLAAAVLYLIGHIVTGRKAGRSFDRLDLLRMLVPAVAFWIWTMIQQGTLFDAVWDWPMGLRSVLGGLGGLALIAVAWLLSYEADEATPKSPG